MKYNYNIKTRNSALTETKATHFYASYQQLNLFLPKTTPAAQVAGERIWLHIADMKNCMCYIILLANFVSLLLKHVIQPLIKLMEFNRIVRTEALLKVNCKYGFQLWNPYLTLTWSYMT